MGKEGKSTKETPSKVGRQIRNVVDEIEQEMIEKLTPEQRKKYFEELKKIDQEIERKTKKFIEKLKKEDNSS